MATGKSSPISSAVPEITNEIYFQTMVLDIV